MLAAFYLSGNPVHDRVIQSLYEGCPEEKQLIKDFKYTPADVGVVFGVYKSKVPISWPRGEVYRRHRADGAEMIVLETGYIKRGDGPENYYAAGFNGLNGRADFKNKNSPPDRFLQLGIDVKPWRENGHHILVCGQVPWDASVDHLDYEWWRAETMNYLTQKTKREVRFREHPCRGNLKPLAEDLRDCWAVVTLNSNTAVDAAIEGIPAFVGDKGSMAYGIANLDLADIENPCLQDRTYWLHWLAYTQWTPAEMQKGETWKHLFP